MACRTRHQSICAKHIDNPTTLQQANTSSVQTLAFLQTAAHQDLYAAGLAWELSWNKTNVSIVENSTIRFQSEPRRYLVTVKQHFCIVLTWGVCPTTIRSTPTILRVTRSKEHVQRRSYEFMPSLPKSLFHITLSAPLQAKFAFRCSAQTRKGRLHHEQASAQISTKDLLCKAEPWKRFSCRACPVDECLAEMCSPHCNVGRLAVLSSSN